MSYGERILAQMGISILVVWVLGSCISSSNEPRVIRSESQVHDELRLLPDEHAHEADVTVPVEELRGPGTPPVDVSHPPKYAKKAKNGVFYHYLSRGDRAQGSPNGTDMVRVHFQGWTTEGQLFDTTMEEGITRVVRIEDSLPGWREVLPRMMIGDIIRIWAPEGASHGQRNTKVPSGMLVYELELIEFAAKLESRVSRNVSVERSSPHILAPPDVANPPNYARRTPSGLRYRYLTRGKGARRPNQVNRVTVHYTGWTTDGRMFDSSVKRGRPATFRLTHLIQGWTEGLQLMHVGDQVRFWIPENLAYKGNPGKPKGMLVFDIELLKIE